MQHHAASNSGTAGQHAYSTKVAKVGVTAQADSNGPVHKGSVVAPVVQQPAGREQCWTVEGRLAVKVVTGSNPVSSTLIDEAPGFVKPQLVGLSAHPKRGCP
jgi:hypothetical protein